MSNQTAWLIERNDLATIERRLSGVLMMDRDIEDLLDAIREMISAEKYDTSGETRAAAEARENARRALCRLVAEHP